MVKTIGNPLTWATQGVAGAGEYVAEAAETLGSHEIAKTHPKVMKLTAGDILDALKAGYEDFAAARTDVMAICVLYPAIGLLLFGFSYESSMMHLLFPLIAGFALIAPAAAVGFYEISRRREKGEQAGWFAAFKVMGAPSFAAVLVLGLYQLTVFLLWIVTAHRIFTLTLGPTLPTSLGAFATEVLTTGPGWAMIVIGVGVGFLFALAVLATSVVSFPMLLDRHVGLPVAVTTSIRVTRKNPVVVSIWGLVIAGLLIAGSVPLLLGLIVVLPLLGHATWHFYRRAVSW